MYKRGMTYEDVVNLGVVIDDIYLNDINNRFIICKNKDMIRLEDLYCIGLNTENNSTINLFSGIDNKYRFVYFKLISDEPFDIDEPYTYIIYNTKYNLYNNYKNKYYYNKNI